MSLALEAKRVEYATHQKGGGSGGEVIPRSAEVSQSCQEKRSTNAMAFGQTVVFACITRDLLS